MIDKMSGWLLISPLIARIICHFQRSPWMEEGKWTSATICPSGIALDPDSSPYVRLWGLRQSPAPVEVIWCFVACSDHPGINWNVSFESFDPRRCLFYPILQVLFLGANMWKKQKVPHLLPSFEPCSAAAPKKGTDSLCPLQSHHQPQPGEGIALPKKGPRRSHLKFQIFISMFKRLSIIYEVLGKLKS